MSDAKARKNAFEGPHITLGGARAFRVYYLNLGAVRDVKAKLKAAGLRVYPPGHPKAIKVGWYWITETDYVACKAEKRHGPFTSSRRAYHHACATLEPKE